MVIDNDTVLIKYKFRGYNCPATVYIFNKLDVPLYVDWKRSSFILDGKNIRHFDETSFLQAEAMASATKISGNLSTSSEITGTITHSPAVSFVPPRSYVEGSPINLRHSFFQAPVDGYEIIRFPGFAPLKVGSFAREENPFSFRHFLTLSTAPDLSTMFSFDIEFWTRNIATSGSRPASLPIKRSQDQFFLSKPAEGYAFAGVMLVILMVAALAAN